MTSQSTINKNKQEIIVNKVIGYFHGCLHHRCCACLPAGWKIQIQKLTNAIWHGFQITYGWRKME